jgi:ribosome-associated heat shock protein Hsp15
MRNDTVPCCGKQRKAAGEPRQNCGFDSNMTETPDRIRLDKWLWAARFFKTRSLAAEAVQSGKVRLGDVRVKPAREIRAGDVIRIRTGDTAWLVTVRVVSGRRGPAPQAVLLYEEDPGSRAVRMQAMADRKLAPHPASGSAGRPTKKQRRQIVKFTSGK